MDSFKERTPVVCIGAAKDGIEKVCNLFEDLGADTGMAFIYLQHTEGSTNDAICAAIEKATRMPVSLAAHSMQIEPDHVYIVPLEENLVLNNEVFNTRPASREHTMSPIDVFFSSLAEDHPSPIGILLSGSDQHGTTGLKAIKLAGGITFILDDTATIAQADYEDAADFIFPADQIAKELDKLNKINNVSDVLTDKQPADQFSEHLSAIIKLLKKIMGVDFSQYKISTIKRRIVRRMLLHKFESLNKYHEYLKQNTTEITSLYNDLLINVTSFFRDGDTTEYLRKTILSQLFKSKAKDEPIRIWIPACSTGEEAYSLAMLIVEMQEEFGYKHPIHIFGTDLSELAIAKARQGRYLIAELVNVSNARLNAFFVKADNNTYRINKKIRDLCVFAHHNLLKDPPFTRLDMISCCNLFIYLDSELQEKCIGIFYYALNQYGYLVLGRSETITAAGQHFFTQPEKKFKVYIRKNLPSLTTGSSEMVYRFPVLEKTPLTEKERTAGDAIEIPNLEKTVDDVLYSKYIPAAVVINQQWEILQFRGSTNLFLEPSRGKASFNLLKMARPGLILDLRNCIHKAATANSVVRRSNIELTVKDQSYAVSIEVIPLRSDNDERLFLVIFEEERAIPFDPHTAFSRDEVIEKLQRELNTVRNDMRSIIEEQEANKEKLQAANEEIISTNEELQSINEELETSKEELESTNEELTSINTELKMSNDQLTEAQNYAQAIFETIREAVIVLNKGLRVKLANASCYRIFNMLSEEMEGRSLFELGSGQWDTPQLKALLNDVVHNGVQLSGHEVQFDFPDIGRRTMLLNARKVVQNVNNQELILLAFEDITDRKRAEKMTAEREEWFKNMANNAPVMIWTAGVDGMRTFFNVTWFTFTGRSFDEEKDYGWISGVHPEDRKYFLAIYEKAFEEKKTFKIEYRLRRYDGEYRWVQALGKPTFSSDKEFTGLVGICAEIHDSRIMRDELEKLVNQRTADLLEANNALKRSNDELQQFAYVASHDLQEPLRKIQTFSDRLTAIGNLPDMHKQYIDKISNSAERMSQLIDDLLDFSRAIKINDAFVPTDLNKVLKSVLADFELIIKEKNATIKTGSLPVIDAIPVQMEQLFHNLISNSLKFSKTETPVMINITCKRLSPEEARSMTGIYKEKDVVEILIEDNGIGFSGEFSEQIFTIFQRLHEKDEYPGTGIGLALCRKITDNHGGTIYATSSENTGSTFHVVLPVKQ